MRTITDTIGIGHQPAEEHKMSEGTCQMEAASL